MTLQRFFFWERIFIELENRRVERDGELRFEICENQSERCRVFGEELERKLGSWVTEEP